MEIIFEIIFQILGWVFQLLGELFLQLVFEVIAEFFGHSIREPFRRPHPFHPWLAAVGYFTYGAMAGGLSLWLFPDNFIKVEWLRVSNLLLTPLAAGLLMAWIGSWRSKHERDVIRLETFFYGFFFALSLAIVRFVWGG